MRLFLLDGSALAKRYIAEIGTPLVDYLFDHVTADRMLVLNIGVAEVISVLVRRKNAGILSANSLLQALLWLGNEIINAPTLRKLEPTNSLVVGALVHILNHSINATDAVVLQTALRLAQDARIKGGDLVLVASDKRLIRAARAEGIETFDPEVQDHSVLTVLASS
jgi:predicted nucleic acid-binding protein